MNIGQKLILYRILRRILLWKKALMLQRRLGIKTIIITGVSNSRRILKLISHQMSQLTINSAKEKINPTRST